MRAPLTEPARRPENGVVVESEDKPVYLIILQKANPLQMTRNKTALILAIEENPTLISEILLPY